MITQAEITAASSTLSETAILSLVALVRTSDRYKTNPAEFVDLKTRLENLDGGIEAKQINAALTKIEAIGSTVVEIDQRRTVGTDGVVFSTKLSRDTLIDYILNVAYEESFSSVTVDGENENFVLRGEYGVGRWPQSYEGYL